MSSFVTTRSSQPRRKISSSSRQQSTRRSSDHDALNEYAEEYDDMDVDDPSVSVGNEIDRAVRPLQKLAERVGKEVEIFAEELDKWRPKMQQTEIEAKQTAILGLISEYKTVAQDTVHRLHSRHGEDLKALMKGDRSKKERHQQGRLPISGELPDTQLEDLIRWQEELHTWRLFHALLECDFGRTNVTKLVGDDNAFTADGEYWVDFLLSSRSAQERLVVIKWLQCSAEVTGQDLDLIEDQLNHKTGRTTYDGWTDTREKIKSEKRLRLWDVPIDIADSSGHPIRDLEGTRSLVTQLDPDAVTRQKLDLEKDDVQFERSFWTMIWEMIRRGTPMSNLSDWCAQRNELAKAMSIGAHCPRTVQFPLTRFLWRQTCQILSRVGGVNEFERGVFGFLGGDTEFVRAICKGWNDFLMVECNGNLLKQYESWLAAKYGDQFNPGQKYRFELPITNSIGTNRGTQETLISDYSQIKQQPGANGEASLQPVQAALVRHEGAEFLLQQGIAMANRLENEDDLISRLIHRGPAKRTPQSTGIKDLTDNGNALRVLTHIYLMLLELEYDFGQGSSLEAVENVLCAYIGFLAMAGKYKLIPGYASRLSRNRQIETLALVMTQIHKDFDQSEFVALMREVEVPVAEVVSTLVNLSFKDSSIHSPTFDISSTCSRIQLMKPESDPVWPGQRIRLLSEDETDMTFKEIQLLNSIQWFNYIDDAWARTLSALTEVAVALLQTGRFSAAAALFTSMPPSELSSSKILKRMERAEDTIDDYEGSDDDVTPALRRSARMKSYSYSGSRKRTSTPDQVRIRRDLLEGHAKTYFQLEQLSTALSALLACGEIEDQQFQASKPTSIAPAEVTNVAALRHDHRKAIDDAVQCMNPLLQSFLTHTCPYVRTSILQALRIAYLPEMILAYQSLLHCAGYMSSREHLLQCMDLANDVAANDGLIECFKAAPSPLYRRGGEVAEWGNGQVNPVVAPSNEVVASKDPNASEYRRNDASEGLLALKSRDELRVVNAANGSGRLKEFVEGMAAASKAILRLNERPGTKGSKIRQKERTLGIWDVVEE